MRSTEEAILREHPLFSELASHDFDELMRSATVERFPAETTFMCEGAPAEYLHLVDSGLVELYSHLSGRETSIAVQTRGAAFVVAAVVKHGPYPLSARALESTRLIRFPAFKIREAMAKHASLARAIAYELTERYSDVLEMLKNQKLRRSVHRVAKYLVAQHQDQGAGGHITLPVKKQTLASLLGITPSALSRAFSTLRAFGVAVHGNEIELAECGELTAFADYCACGCEHETGAADNSA